MSGTQRDGSSIGGYMLSARVRHMPLKRLFDIVFSLCALLFFLPLCLIIAVLVGLTSRGGVFYAHERVGRGGHRFRCYKFRSMYVDADRRLEELLAKDPVLRAEWASTRKLRNDLRVTPIGACLRKTSLDEIPQFLNVLKGDLSVVGPRPVVELEIIKFLGPKATKILSIRPGLTCFWQVSGRTDTTYAERVQMDEQYVDERTMGTDIKLIAKTIPVMFSSRGAY